MAIFSFWKFIFRLFIEYNIRMNCLRFEFVLMILCFILIRMQNRNAIEVTFRKHSWHYVNEWINCFVLWYLFMKSTYVYSIIPSNNRIWFSCFALGFHLIQLLTWYKSVPIIKFRVSMHVPVRTQNINKYHMTMFS